MKKTATVLAALAASTTLAAAGGVERSTQSVNILFEKGRYAEFSLGTFSPDVSGVRGVSSGDMSPSYLSYSFGYKMAIGDNIDFAVILDQPIGADVDYPVGTGYLLAGTNAKLSSTAVTGLLRYKFDNNISLIGGIRAEAAKGRVQIRAPLLGIANYQLTTSREYDLGYVVGIAWEKPEIAARVALTYNSAIKHDLQSTESGLSLVPVNASFETEVPQSVNLEFQTGVAKNTLVFGSIRWVDWSVFDIAPPVYVGATGSPLVSYQSDRVTYTLGVGRKFNDTWSGALILSHEDSNGDLTGNLGPTDGFTSIGLAATYTQDKMKITAGVRYVDIGDATTNPPVSGQFTGNHGVGAGIRISYSF